MPGGVTWVLGFFKAPNCLKCTEIFRIIAGTDIPGALQTALSSLFLGISGLTSNLRLSLQVLSAHWGWINLLFLLFQITSSPHFAQFYDN